MPVNPTTDVLAVTAAALEFVRTEADFAQVTSIDRMGYPVTRSMTAFLQDDWQVALVQRAGHHRLRQWRFNPKTLVTWVGAPAPGQTNERPHVFDLGRVPARVVAVRGDVQFMPADWTVRTYRAHLQTQRSAGLTRAPVRSDEQVRAELVGVILRPIRVRIEGFGRGAQSFDLTITAKEQHVQDHPGI